HPRLAPEGMTDLVAALGASVVIFAELLVLPVLAYAAVGAGNPGAWVAGAAVLVAELAAALLTAVHWLKLDARGIHLGRWMGLRFVPWADVTAVRRAPGSEVVLRGWLWPPLPPAEATRSLTIAGHLAIEHRQGVSYFPPVEETALLAAVRRWAPHVRLPAWEGGPPAAPHPEAP
ncbi:MAG TPA: hypothetical protein VF541_02750, partial [Longimicrobium sp.]